MISGAGFMKKELTAAVLSFVTLLTVGNMNANARSERYIPTLYFKAEESDEVRTDGDSTVWIDGDLLKKGDIDIKTGIYIEDTEKGIYRLTVKWNCDSEYISLSDPVDPREKISEVRKYRTKDGREFMTDKTPFAYGNIDSGGNMVIPYNIQIAGADSVLTEKKGRNARGFTYDKGVTLNTDPFGVLGATSDEYEYCGFTATVSSDIPDGEYEIRFMTDGNSLDVKCGGQFNYNDGGSSNSFIPYVKDLKLIVSDEPPANITLPGKYKLGDVDGDGTVDSSDASMILKDYAAISTGGTSELLGDRKKAADTDGDGSVDSSDASLVLAFYAEKSVGMNYDSMESYLSARKNI